MTIYSMNLPTSSQDNCFHFLEVEDYLSGTPGKCQKMDNFKLALFTSMVIDRIISFYRNAFFTFFFGVN